jgi:DnaJ-class molecular chaperone
MSAKRAKISDGPEQSPYEVLELEETASAEAIRKAYLAQVRLHPPEKDPNGFKAIRRAYDSLKDSAQRKMLDFTLFRRESGLGPFDTAAANWNELFLDRTMQLFLVSSDLYSNDFSGHFRDISDKIKDLK